ncbi:response regulator [Micromonospora sp. WMMD736]|uniref:response regulator n=1 Tax=Micromonospora sp. WMMD736 TaxID=3404112 RepID=UPI003B9543FA
MELRTPPVPNGELNNIRIALVDDHALFREGVSEILQLEKDIEVVAEAGDSTAAIAAIGETRPDIVLLDVEIPGDDVGVTVRRIRAASPETKTIILSMHDSGVLVQRLLGLGVHGYLHKSVSRLGLLAAIRDSQVNDSHIVVSVSPHSLVPSREGIVALSEREREVLHLVARAMSNAQIANRLGLTEATVKRHLRNIFAKLSAVSRLDAVNKAVAAALIDPALPVKGPSAARRPA